MKMDQLLDDMKMLFIPFFTSVTTISLLLQKEYYNSTDALNLWLLVALSILD